MLVRQPSGHLTRQGIGPSWTAVKAGLAIMMAGGLTLATAVEANSAASPAPTPDALQDDPLDQPTQLQAELRARDKAQVTAALKALSTQTDAFIAPALVEPRSTPVLVLPGRATPYDLAALAAQHPIALSARPDSAILLHLPVIVGPGATLGADATTARTVLLTSSARGYAPLIAAGGTIAFTGTAFQPLAVRSFDPSTGQADTDLTDGRAYVSASATRMDLDHVVASDLGFLVGETSGVAWMARGGTPSSGGASDSTFTRNYFGAYSSGAVGLVFSRSQFLDNIVYGLDPHTGTRQSVVEDSLAAGNGRHGVILSRQCDDNVVRRLRSVDNGGAGIVVDDGFDGGPLALGPSNRNRFIDVEVARNQTAGIVVEGGEGNSVDAGRIADSPVGVWIKNGARHTSITNTAISRSSQTGIRINSGTAGTTVRNVTIADSHVGVASDGARLTTLTDVEVTDSTAAAIEINGAPDQVSAAHTVVQGSGRAAFLLDGTSAAPADMSGIDASRWSESTTGRNAIGRIDFWIRLLPWILVLAIPAMFRMRTRATIRRRRTQIPRGET